MKNKKTKLKQAIKLSEKEISEWKKFLKQARKELKTLQKENK